MTLAGWLREVALGLIPEDLAKCASRIYLYPANGIDLCGFRCAKDH
jgi:hypothetical protein